MKAIKYEKEYREIWNSFLEGSKNGNFLFNRNYMEYHSDRHEDHSLLFFDDRERLQAIMPACKQEDVLSSHGGLTYGGMISSQDMHADTMLRVFDALIEHLRQTEMRTILYKAIPHVFHRIPAEEDLYALQRSQARLTRRDLSSVIHLPSRLKFSKGKREGIKKALRADLEVRESGDFASFFAIGRKVMEERHQVAPVHNSEEMELLASRFPGMIRLHASYSSDTMLAGVISYLFGKSVHVQYMYNSDEGLEKGALDIVLGQLINEVYSGLEYFSFGISTEKNGQVLNGGLLRQKEMFGARAIVHDFYEIEL